MGLVNALSRKSRTNGNSGVEAEPDGAQLGLGKAPEIDPQPAHDPELGVEAADADLRRGRVLGVDPGDLLIEDAFGRIDVAPCG